MDALDNIALLILAIPLLGGMLALLRGKTGPYIQAISVALAAIFSLGLFANTEASIHWSAHWFQLGDYNFTVGILLTRPALFMTCVVTIISFLVSLFSLGYMKTDVGRNRYHFALGLFTSTMLGIVYADNLLVLFIFWELVGFTSYLLINHYYQKEAASLASMKAFIVNRIGDAGFVIGMAILWSFNGSLELSYLMDNPLDDSWGTAASLCLFLGVIGKSAQFPLQIWLPDAMEGPTPASALIHAATMVAAGVYLLFRTLPFLSPASLEVITVVGAITAFMGAVAAISQYDIKKVLAFSTISQLGYMVLAMGIVQAEIGIFHLFTHAFFKAGLFLGAGAIIFALHEIAHKTGEAFDAQDMRNMGGLRKRLPVVYILYMVFTAALIGLPLTSGFLSKDAILAGSLEWADGLSSWKAIVPGLAFITVFLTAFYMTQQIVMVFFGESRLPVKEAKIISTPWVMRIPMLVLALCSLWILWSVNPLSPESWGLITYIIPSIEVPSADIHLVVSGVAVLLVIGGISLGWFLHAKRKSFVRVEDMSPWARLSYNNWWLNRMSRFLAIKPTLQIANVCRWIDKNIIDGLVNAVGLIYVVFSHIVAWFDKHFVDGMIHVIAGTARATGNVSSAATRAGAQWYVWLAVGGGLIILWFLI